MSEWQPIETAPKDVELLLFTFKRGVLRGRFDDIYNEWMCGIVPISPTHWMPLPEPPDTSRQLHETPDSAAQAVD